MATRKGICPYCNIARFENRIFAVNPEATICFCPNCMREMEPGIAIKAYDKYIASLLNKADESLYMKCDPSSAYQDYADVIEVDNTVVEGYLGRLLSMIYMSKVRTNYLNEARTLLEDEVDDLFLKANVLDKFIPFLKKINRVLDDYYNVVSRRLAYHEKYFYDNACLSLYVKIAKQVFDFKNDLLKYSMIIRRKYSNQNIEVLINLLEQSIDSLERLREKELCLATGVYYHLVKFKPDGNPEFEKVEKRKASYNILRRIRFSSLEPTKGKKLIKDDIFKNYTRVMKASKAAIFWYIFSYLVAIGAGVTAYLFFEDKMIFYIALIGAGLFFLLGTVFFILRLSWKKVVKKRRAAFNQ